MAKVIELIIPVQVFTSTKSQTKREKSNVHSLSIVSEQVTYIHIYSYLWTSSNSVLQSSPASLIKFTLLKLLQICEKLLLRDKLITVYEEKVDRLLQWLIRRTDDLNSAIGRATEDAASGATLVKTTNEERPAKYVFTSLYSSKRIIYPSNVQFVHFSVVQQSHHF